MGVRKYISFNALRLRFRLVASDFPGIVCILDADRSGAVESQSRVAISLTPMENFSCGSSLYNLV